jgi:hypothetical protein
MKVYFTCPVCEHPEKVNLRQPSLWQCPACDHRLSLNGPSDRDVSECVICGNHELYKKKDFPHGLGMTILVLACVVSFITYGWYEKWWTWAILIGTAVFDGLLYLMVGDALVCYRCHAHYKGIPKGTRHLPFDLGTGERYRQERIRREQMQAEQQASTEK